MAKTEQKNLRAWLREKRRWVTRQGRKRPVWMAAACCVPVLILGLIIWSATDRDAMAFRNITWGFGSYLAAVMAILGAYLANRRTEELVRQNEIALRGQDDQIYVSAVGQLGDDDIHIRTGGVYGLGRLAENAKDKGERQQIIQLIASFARTRAPLRAKEGAEEKGLDERTLDDYETQKEKHDLVDVETAVKTLAKVAKKDDRDGKLIDLSDMGLIHVNLEGVNFSGFNLRRSFLHSLRGANLSGAHLSEVNLPMAVLSEANLSAAFLPEANLSTAFLFKANLSGAFLFKANLSTALLPEANLSGAFLFKANFSGANFSGANFSETNLDEVINMEQWQVDEMIYKAEALPKNLPEGLKLKEQDRRRVPVNDGVLLILPEEKRERRKREKEK